MSYAIISLKERKKLYNHITVDEVCDEIKIELPKFKEKSSIRYGKNVSKILKKYKVSNAVLDEELLGFKAFINVLNENDNYIITGRRMYKVLLPIILRDTARLSNINMQEINITLLVDEYSIENLDLIKCIADEVKHVTLITNNAYRFEKLVDELLHYKGISIKLLNKGKYNLKKDNYVVNVDFTSEDFNKINLPINAIVISLNGEKHAIKKNFNGIYINDVDIFLGKKEKNFRSLSLCEAYIYNYMKGIRENQLLFNRSVYKLDGYIGINGYITQEDFERIGKILLESKTKKYLTNIL